MTIKLIVVQGRPAGRALRFPPGQYYFGRGAECHVRPNSDWVSRQHCLLRVTRDEAWLRDLGSRNGTLVNGELLAGERRLETGDQIQVGPLVFEVQPDSLTPAEQVATSVPAEARATEAEAAAAPSSDMLPTAEAAAAAPNSDMLSTTQTHPALPAALKDQGKK